MTRIGQRLAKDAAIYGGADFFGKFIAFVTFPIIAAALSPLAFGALELILVPVALLGLFVNCGLNNSAQRFYWDNDTTPEMRPALVSAGMYVQLGFGMAAVVIGLAIVPHLLPIVERHELPLTAIALVAAVILLPLQQWMDYLLDVVRLHFAPLKFFAVNMIAKILTAALSLYAVLVLAGGVDELLVAQVIALVLVLPLALWFVRRDLVLAFDRAWAKKLVLFGYPFIFASMAHWLFGSMDRWMLAAMTSVEEVGIYSVSFRFSTLVLFVSMAFAQAWSPWAIKIKTDYPDTYREIYVAVLKALLAAMLVVGGSVALFAGELIGTIMPVEYAASALPLAILCFGVIIESTKNVTALGISLERRTIIFAKLAWVVAVVNLIANLLLIPLFGAAGAALATTLSYLVLTGSYLYFSQRLHPLPIRWRALAWISALGAVVAAAAIGLHSLEIDVVVIGVKLAIGLACAALALPALSVNRLFALR